jgi:hypothetical protein
MAGLDIGQLVNDIVAGVKPIIEKDGATLSAFAQRQIKAMAEQAKSIEEGVLAGDFKGRDELLKHHLDMLKTMAQNFAKVIVGLQAVTIEKVWNAAVKIVWEAIDKAVGFKLPRP